jgi:membrane protein required for colicin V production
LHKNFIIILIMTWLDVILGIIILALLIHGIVIGLIRGVFDIIGIILGYLLAVSYSGMIKIPKFLAFLLIFIIAVVAISVLGRVISKFIHITPLGSIDRILGGMLGLLKGLIICFVFLIILLLINKSTKVIDKSEIAPWVLKSGLKMSQVLPKRWYHWLEELITKRALVEHHEYHHFYF